MDYADILGLAATTAKKEVVAQLESMMTIDGSINEEDLDLLKNVEASEDLEGQSPESVYEEKYAEVIETFIEAIKNMIV